MVSKIKDYHNVIKRSICLFTLSTLIVGHNYKQTISPTNLPLHFCRSDYCSNRLYDIGQPYHIPVKRRQTKLHDLMCTVGVIKNSHVLCFLLICSNLFNSNVTCPFLIGQILHHCSGFGFHTGLKYIQVQLSVFLIFKKTGDECSILLNKPKFNKNNLHS